MKKWIVISILALFVLTMPLSAAVSDPLTIGEKNAVKKAQSYINLMPFSEKGLIHQLEYEGYSRKDAEYGVSHIIVDWNEQAALKAERYLELMSFSRKGLIHQLEYEKFTPEQAEYGAKAVGY